MKLIHKIWQNPTCILIIFAGMSAEFALHPQADWLFFTGKLPSNPIERLASTVQYLQKAFFAPTLPASHQMSSEIKKIHSSLEAKRGFGITPAAYQDVLLMLILYSFVAYELAFNQLLHPTQKDEIIQDFSLYLHPMQLERFPQNHEQFLEMRQSMLSRLAYNEWTPQLLQAYQVHLGRYGQFLLSLIYQQIVAQDILIRLHIEPTARQNFQKNLFRWACYSGFIQHIYHLCFPKHLSTILDNFGQPQPLNQTN